jgi:diketogulonate reductase-like aldo/keto reductase
MVVPAIGYGTWAMGEEQFLDALEAGYRLFDSARGYGNEAELGRAMARSGLLREEILVTTKVAPGANGYESTLEDFNDSLAALRLDYVDIYLIHWPNPATGRFVDTWRAMIELRAQGLVKSIGVCNFTATYLRVLIDQTGVVPAINQIERHPRFANLAQTADNASLGIVTQSWSPLGAGGDVLKDPVSVVIAARHGVTPAQVVLRWHLLRGSLPLPRSANPARLRANLDVFGLELSEEELVAIESLDTGRRLQGQDPETTNYS